VPISQLLWTSLVWIPFVPLFLGCPYGDRFSEVSGSVLDSAGRPYSGALVTFALMRQDSLIQSDSSRTRQDGAFVFVVDGGLDGHKVSLGALSGGSNSKVDLDINGRGSSHLHVTFTLTSAAAGAP
jgi:hypothetical protein